MSTLNTQKNPMTNQSTSNCCPPSDCESGLRNRYFFGKQLSPLSFQVEQRHIRERQQRLNRALHGHGVVYGFGVKHTEDALAIQPGLALDALGRQLLEEQELTHTLTPMPQSYERTRTSRDLIFINEDGSLWDAKKEWVDSGETPPVCLLLRVHYAEQDVEEVRVSDSCKCEHTERNYTCETIRYSLQRLQSGDCCQESSCEWKCECEKNELCQTGDERTLRRGGDCLCEKIAGWSPEGEDCGFYERQESCGSVRVDLKNGVPLACIQLTKNKSTLWSIGKVDACTSRQLVLRNNVLYDLIQGCDLTYIANYGWKEWHRNKVDFASFAEAFVQPEERKFWQEEEPKEQYVTRRFWVEFSRPVQRKTVRPDCFAMTIITAEADDRWWETARVPIVDVHMHGGDLIDRATIIVGGRWLRGTILSDSSRFQNGRTRVEIEVRGDLIVDCNGQTIDANAHGLSQGRTGNGTPGGTFLSTFRVTTARNRGSQVDYDELDQGDS